MTEQRIDLPPFPVIVLNAALFPLGELVISANAARRLNPLAVAEAVNRHAAGDWGSLSQDDVELNNASLVHGDRLLSAYGEGEDRFWIITEADRSVTTVLLPEDY